LNRSNSPVNESYVKENKTPSQLQDVVNPKNMFKNHALRFSQYSLRKGQDRKMWQLPIISYLEPYDYIQKNKGIKFEKMGQRNQKDLINSSSMGNPSV